jgi:PTH1 family peptidyl-tRNA hydrolase
MSSWLVVGLGNPGEKYAQTRHNIGARAAERLADRLGSRLRKVRFIPIEAAEASLVGERVHIARPQTFMNVSGPPVASFAKRRKVDVENVIVCHDEIDIAFGALKVKRGGSTAGHNGLRSLQQAFRSPDFLRVRLGVGRPPGSKDAADHVLDTFSKAEREEVELLIEDGADAVETLIREGLTQAQERHNRSGPSA